MSTLYMLVSDQYGSDGTLYGTRQSAENAKKKCPVRDIVEVSDRTSGLRQYPPYWEFQELLEEKSYHLWRKDRITWSTSAWSQRTWEELYEALDAAKPSALAFLSLALAQPEKGRKKGVKRRCEVLKAMLQRKNGEQQEQEQEMPKQSKELKHDPPIPSTPKAPPEAKAPSGKEPPKGSMDEMIVRLIREYGVDREVLKTLLAEEIAALDLESPQIRIEWHGEKRKPIKLPEGEMAHQALKETLGWIDQGEYVAVIGPAGTGKSHLARQLANATGRVYHSQPFHEDSTVTSILGRRDLDGAFVTTPFLKAWEGEKSLWVGEEYDAAPPGVSICTNEAFGNRGGTISVPNRTDNPLAQGSADHAAIICMNTFGFGPAASYVGRFAQDGANLDRFVKVYVDYDKKLEKALCGGNEQLLEAFWDIRDKASRKGLRKVVSMRATTRYAKAMIVQGWKLDKCLKHFLRDWTTDERKLVGR